MPSIRTFSVLAVALAGLALAACAGQEPATTVRHVFYDCADAKSFIAAYYPRTQRADLVLEGRTFVLAQQPSASGFRYGNGRMTLFGRGSEAFLEIDGVRAYSGCVALTG